MRSALPYSTLAHPALYSTLTAAVAVATSSPSLSSPSLSLRAVEEEAGFPVASFGCLPATSSRKLANNHTYTRREAKEAGNKYTKDRTEAQMGVVLLRHPKEGGIDPVGRNPCGAFLFGIEFGLYREDPIRIEK